MGTERNKRDWLHPFPDCISPRRPYKDTSEEINFLRKDVKNYPFKVLDKGIDSWQNEPQAKLFSWGPYTCLVVDIAKHGREHPVRRVFDSDDLDQFVRRGRTVEKAKKRFPCVTVLSSPSLSVADSLKLPFPSIYRTCLGALPCSSKTGAL